MENFVLIIRSGENYCLFREPRASSHFKWLHIDFQTFYKGDSDNLGDNAVSLHDVHSVLHDVHSVSN